MIIKMFCQCSEEGALYLERIAPKELCDPCREGDWIGPLGYFCLTSELLFGMSELAFPATTNSEFSHQFVRERAGWQEISFEEMEEILNEI